MSQLLGDLCQSLKGLSLPLGGLAALGVFLDLKKAFDTADHRIIPKQLEHYNIRGDTLGLLESYLKGQDVCYRGYESPRRKSKCGVPQESVPRPLFFITYVNDGARACSGLQLVLFADDTSGFAKDRDPARLLGRAKEGQEQLSRCLSKKRVDLSRSFKRVLCLNLCTLRCSLCLRTAFSCLH